MDPSGIVIIAILILLAGFFSAAETAFVSISPAKVRALLEVKTRGAVFLEKLKETQHRTLTTILLCNTFLNIAASALTTITVEKAFGSPAIGIATGILTFIVLLFGEILPKSMASANPKSIALFSAPFLYALGLILAPIIVFFDAIIWAVLKILRIKKQMSVSDEELIAMAEIGMEEGAIRHHEKEFIENVLEFTDIKVGEIMTPRVHIDSMPEDYDVKESAEFILNHTHSRFPVYRGSIDHIVGIVSLKEVFEHLHEEETEKTLRQIKLRTPIKVSETMQVHDLFLIFKRHKQHIAIVVDEFGGTAGLVTMEDLLEEIVGDIEDESDKEEDFVKKITDIEYEVSGRIQLEELEELIGVELDESGHQPLSFLIEKELGRSPKKGDKILVKGWELSVLNQWRGTILKVRVKKAD